MYNPYYIVLTPGGGEMWIRAISERDAIRQAKESYGIDGIDLRGRGKSFKVLKQIESRQPNK